MYLLDVLRICNVFWLICSHGSIPVASLGVSRVLTVEEIGPRGYTLAIEASTAMRMRESIFHFKVCLALTHEQRGCRGLIMPLLAMTVLPVVLLHLFLNRTDSLFFPLGVGGICVNFIQVVN